MAYRLAGHILNVYALHWVVAFAWNRENWEFSQKPGDVVEEDVSGTENQGRAKDCVRHSRPADYLLRLALASEIGKRGVERGIRNADMDDPTNSCLFCCSHQYPNVSDGLVEGLETNPVGVI